MVEYYPDTIAVDSSLPARQAGILSVITTMRLNSMVEIYRYKVEVVGSIPAVATKLVRNSIGSEYRSFTPRVVSSSLTRPTRDRAGRRGCKRPTANRWKEVRFFCTTIWMNSSMAEFRHWQD